MALKRAYLYAGLAAWLAIPLLARRRPGRQASVPAVPPGDPAAPAQLPPQSDFSVARFPAHVLADEQAILASPTRLREKDLRWIVPLAGLATLSLNFDRDIMRSVVPLRASFHRRSCQVSDVLACLLLSAPVALYAIGTVGEHEKAREAGFVGGEAIFDAYLLNEALKLITWRERPGRDDDRGRFFDEQAGWNSSFVSSHSMLCWTSASVLALEYPSPALQCVLYGAAASVSLTRVLGQRHFPTDVLLGGVAGWFLGHYVHGARHGLQRR